MHQTQFSEKIPYGGFSQIRSHLFLWPSFPLMCNRSHGRKQLIPTIKRSYDLQHLSDHARILGVWFDIVSLKWLTAVHHHCIAHLDLEVISQCPRVSKNQSIHQMYHARVLGFHVFPEFFFRMDSRGICLADIG